jgi:hypothetical protein
VNGGADGGESSDSNGGACSEYNFTEALVRVAKVRYGGDGLGATQSLGVLLDRMLVEMVAPAWKKKGVADIPASLKDPQVKQFLGNCIGKLTTVYKYYAQNGTVSTGNVRPTIDFNEFLRLLIDAGLIPSEG